MASPTSNYAFQKPDIGGDDDAWGDHLNDNWDSIDTLLKAVSDAAVANAAAIAALDEARKIPVGGLYLSIASTNPATSLGYGTWAAYAAGRALVGVGSNGEATWAAAESRGSEVHTLTTAELPAHAHSIDPPATALSIDAVGDHTHAVAARSGVGAVQQYDGTTGAFTAGNATGAGGAHTHTGTVNIAPFNSANAGSGNAHNNVQPSIAVYVWRRTA